MHNEEAEKKPHMILFISHSSILFSLAFRTSNLPYGPFSFYRKIRVVIATYFIYVSLFLFFSILYFVKINLDFNCKLFLVVTKM